VKTLNLCYNIFSFLSIKKNHKLFYYCTLIIIVQLLFTLIGCGGGGGGSSSSSDIPPSGLTYTSTSTVYTKNLKITDNVPAYSGTVTEWLVYPPLPSGLEMDQSTGTISGTPLSDQGAAEYRVTASNRSGSASTVISIAVKDIPPAALEYSVTSAVYTVGMAVTENKPSYYGTVTSWSIAPGLPEGLILDPATGVITGTPLIEQSAKYYTVTASNPEGSTTAAILITVNNVSPSALEYSAISAVYIKDHAITENTPSYCGTVESWSVTPDLPEGLDLDPSTGKITGTPLAEQDAADYTITAANKYGSATAIVSITVNDVAPSGLSYSTSPAVYTIDEVIAANTPSVTGTVASWSATPDLPKGLTLNTTTGVISGIPEVEVPEADYVITASNPYGSTSCVLSITVNEKAPSDLTYSTASAVYTQGVRIADNVPSVKGSITSWSITPALPQGLILNTTTGVISGTPEVVQVGKSYTVTAGNSQGSVIAVISIKVNHVAPAALVYTPSTAVASVYIKIFGTYICIPQNVNFVPSFSGTVTSWSINKTLPSGITLNQTTGVISGSARLPRGSKIYYTVTAGNSGGSTSATILLETH